MTIRKIWNALDYTHILQNSWQKLQEDFQQGKFDPDEEADIQCYLYHLCLEELGDATRIHAESKYGKGKSADLMLGGDRLPVEIKWSYLRERKETPGGWLNDIRKLSKHYSRRKPVFALFVTHTERKGLTSIREEELTATQIKVFEHLKRYGNKRGVKVLLPY